MERTDAAATSNTWATHSPSLAGRPFLAVGAAGGRVYEAEGLVNSTCFANPALAI